LTARRQSHYTYAALVYGAWNKLLDTIIGRLCIMMATIGNRRQCRI
jgi:hypothetical protein